MDTNIININTVVTSIQTPNGMLHIEYIEYDHWIFKQRVTNSILA